MLPARYPHLYKIFTNRERNITWQQKEEVRVEAIKVLVLYITQVLYLKSRSYRTWIATILHLPSVGVIIFEHTLVTIGVTCGAEGDLFRSPFLFVFFCGNAYY